jgi:hypothetical protein
MRWRNRLHAVTLGCILTLLLASCADRTSQVEGAGMASATDQVVGTSEGQFDPANPMPGGILLTNPQSPDLPFVPSVPASFGTPAVIQMTPPSLVPLAHRSIMFGYTTSPYGPLVISEELTNGGAVNELTDFASEAPGCSAPSPDAEGDTVTCHYGNREILQLAGSGTGILLYDSSHVSVMLALPTKGLTTSVSDEFRDPMLLVIIEATPASRDLGVKIAQEF